MRESIEGNDLGEDLGEGKDKSSGRCSWIRLEGSRRPATLKGISNTSLPLGSVVAAFLAVQENASRSVKTGL